VQKLHDGARPGSCLGEEKDRVAPPRGQLHRVPRPAGGVRLPDQRQREALGA
jgi:hypothetical protein